MNIEFDEPERPPTPSYLTAFLISMAAGFTVAALLDKNRTYTTVNNVTVVVPDPEEAV